MPLSEGYFVNFNLVLPTFPLSNEEKKTKEKLNPYLQRSQQPIGRFDLLSVWAGESTPRFACHIKRNHHNRGKQTRGGRERTPGT
jgi:hypothetical protein